MDTAKDHTHILLDKKLNQDACKALQMAWNESLGDICKKYDIQAGQLIPFGQVNLLMMLRVLALAAIPLGADFEKTKLTYINSLLRMPNLGEKEPDNG